MTSRRREGLLSVATVAVLVGLWYLVSWLLKLSHDPLAGSKLPYPHLVLRDLVADRSTLAVATRTTVSEALLGFVVGAVAAVVLSIVMVQASWVESAIMPYVLAAQMIPLISLVPIAESIFRSDESTRLFIAAFVTFFCVMLVVVRGLKSAPPAAYELLRSYNAGRVKQLRFLTLPTAVPMLFSGLRIAAPLSLVGSILVDMMGAQTGLGYVMLSSLVFGPQHSHLVWAAMLVTLVVGFLMSQAVAVIERFLVPWQVSLRREVA